MSFPDEQLTTNAILTALATTSLDVGDGKAPSPAALPYLVLYDVGAVERDGPMNDQNADAVLAYQVTAVGETREQAAGAREAARTALLPPAVVVPPAGYDWMGDSQLQPGAPAERDDGGGADQPPLFYAHDEFWFYATPA